MGVGILNMAYKSPQGLNQFMDRAIERVHKRRLKAGDVDADLVKVTAKKLWQGVLDGAGDVKALQFGSLAQRMLIQMRFNVHVLAAFKNHHNTLEMVNTLFDAEGNIKTFGAFRNQARKINKIYNQNWLRAEFNTALQTAKNGAEWHRLAAKGGSLQYLTRKDERVGSDHAPLHGAIYPVSHPFWDRFFPPNRFNCRCTVRWAGKAERTVQAKSTPDLKPMFDNNAGKTGNVFSEQHPYFSVDGRFNDKAERLFGHRPPVDPNKFINNLVIFERLKDDSGHRIELTDNISGGFVFVHKQADKKDLVQNLPIARKLARDRGDAVVIREHVHIDRVSNPEFQVGDILADLKTPKSKTGNGIKNAFRNARRQGLEMFVINAKGFNVNDLATGLKNGFRNHSINTALVVFEGRLIEVTRLNYMDGNILEKLRE